MKLSGVVAGVLTGLALSACAPNGKVLRAVDGQILNLTENSIFDIINGEETTPIDSFAASIVGIVNLEDRSICTGSLIADSYVLTAAHCLAQEPRNLRVFFGPSMDKVVSVNAVIAAIAHDFYQDRKTQYYDHGDIALLKFSGPTPKGYQPIQLLPFDSLKVNQETLLAGYGLNDSTNQTGSGVLRKTVVRVAEARFGNSEASLDQRFGTGACSGDSGGPAYLTTETGYYLWGVTSRAMSVGGADPCSSFSIYTKVMSYSNWINQVKVALLGL